MPIDAKKLNALVTVQKAVSFSGQRGSQKIPPPPGMTDPRIGKVVRFKISGLGGAHSNTPVLRTISGMVKRVLPSGDLEIKAQSGGYHVVHPKDLEA